MSDELKFLTASVTIPQKLELVAKVDFLQEVFQRLVVQFINDSGLFIIVDQQSNYDVKRVQKTDSIQKIAWNRIAKIKSFGVSIALSLEERFEQHLNPLVAQLSIGGRNQDDPFTTIAVGLASFPPEYTIKKVVQDNYTHWAKAVFDKFEGVTGYLTHDLVCGDFFMPTSFELSQGLIYSHIAGKFHQQVRGYFWGNFLSTSHVQALGGEGKLYEVPAFLIERVGKGYYIQLTEDINTLQLSDLAKLKAYLKPLLPKPQSDLPPNYLRAVPYLLVHDDDPPIPEPPKPVEITPKVKLEMPKVEFQEVHQWLQNDDPLSALAINRFETPEAGREFIHQLLQLGAIVYVKVTTYPGSPAPHSDALLVKLPTESAQRQQLLKIFTQELIHEGFIEENEVGETVEDNGEEQLYFWWD